jgi:hypothetical protein
MYRDDLDVTSKVTQFGELELHFKFKPNIKHGPFDDPPSDITPEERREWSFEAKQLLGTDCRGQLTSYATEWCTRQHRKWAFSVFIGGPYVRLIHWDRSAAVVTERFHIHNSQPLIDFLWRFCHMTDEERGRDETVRPATNEEVALADLKLQQWKNVKDRPVVVLKIWDTVEDKMREFIAWGSMANADSLTGRSTRAYPVYEIASDAVFFLKDTWRATTLEKESDILQELNAANVPNVPKFECGDDIPGHITRCHIYAFDASSQAPDSPGEPTLSTKQNSWVCGNHYVTEPIHHRFTEDFIGIHLDKFTSTKQMMTAVHDAFLGK